MNISEVKRLEFIRDEEQDDNRKTIVFNGEGHTLGNALRSIILRNPDVLFCGYTVPHPSENKMHLRIQTSKGAAKDALKTGLKQLEELNKHVLATFLSQVEEFKKQKSQ